MLVIAYFYIITKKEKNGFLKIVQSDLMFFFPRGIKKSRIKLTRFFSSRVKFCHPTWCMHDACQCACATAENSSHAEKKPNEKQALDSTIDFFFNTFLTFKVNLESAKSFSLGFLSLDASSESVS